jgi:hypothetical protein
MFSAARREASGCCRLSTEPWQEPLDGTQLMGGYLTQHMQLFFFKRIVFIYLLTMHAINL